jgi:salicylate hydroxylase
VTRKIAIVGGGIGGLAAAAFLNQSGLSATVYEQARELREIGAGLVVAPNMARLLRRRPPRPALRQRRGRPLEKHRPGAPHVRRR